MKITKTLVSFLLVFSMVSSMVLTATAAESSANIGNDRTGVKLDSVTTQSATPTPANSESYDNCTDGNGNLLNPYFVNGNIWTEESGAIKPAEGSMENFLLFDNALTKNRVEATFNLTLNGDGDTRNGIVFALTDYDNDNTFNWDAADVSYYWACISGWEGRIQVLKMGKYDAWNMISAGGWEKCGTPLAELGIDPADGVTLAAEWDDNGHIKVFANGILVEDITDSGTPLTGNLYGVLMRDWANTADGGYSLSYNVSSFIACGALAPVTPTPSNPESYDNCTDGEGRVLNPVFLNNINWELSNGNLRPAVGSAFNFLLFDKALATNRVEATFVIGDNSGTDGDHRNGLVFAVTDHDGDLTVENNWDTGISYYWAFINDWNCVEVIEMGAYQNWHWLTTEAKDLTTLGIDVKEGVTLAAEWDADGHIRVFANGILVQDVVDETPLTGNLYGILQFQWSNENTPDATYVTSFVAGTGELPPQTSDNSMIVVSIIIAGVSALACVVIFKKKRSYNA